MKDQLRALLQESPSPLHGRNLAREYLQARVLGVLQRAGAMIPYDNLAAVLLPNLRA